MVYRKIYRVLFPNSTYSVIYAQTKEEEQSCPTEPWLHIQGVVSYC